MPISNGQLAWTNKYFSAPPRPPTEPEIPPLPAKDGVNPYDIEVKKHSDRQKRRRSMSQVSNKSSVSPVPPVPVLAPVPAPVPASSKESTAKNTDKPRLRALLLKLFLFGLLSGLLMLAILIIALCYGGIICGGEPATHPDVSGILTPPGFPLPCAGRWKEHYMPINASQRCDIKNNTVVDVLETGTNATNFTCCYNFDRLGFLADTVTMPGGWLMCANFCNVSSCNNCFKDDFCKIETTNARLRQSNRTCGGFNETLPSSVSPYLTSNGGLVFTLMLYTLYLYI